MVEPLASARPAARSDPIGARPAAEPGLNVRQRPKEAPAIRRTLALALLSLVVVVTGYGGEVNNDAATARVEKLAVRTLRESADGLLHHEDPAPRPDEDRQREVRGRYEYRGKVNVTSGHVHWTDVNGSLRSLWPNTVLADYGAGDCP